MNEQTKVVAEAFINAPGIGQFDNVHTPTLWTPGSICRHLYETAAETECEANNPAWRREVIIDALTGHMGGYIDWVAIAAEHNKYHAQQA